MKVWLLWCCQSYDSELQNIYKTQEAAEQFVRDNPLEHYGPFVLRKLSVQPLWELIQPQFATYSVEEWDVI